LEIHTGTKAVRAQSHGSKILLTTAPANSLGEQEVIEGDAIVIATGRAANVSGLGLEAAGVAYTARGIPTDPRMKTNIHHIYACGDVNGQLPFTHVAGYEAGIALTNSVLHLSRKADYSRIGWCTYTDPEVASVGLNEKRARNEGMDYQIIEELFVDNDRALTEGETLGKIKILLNPRGKLLGCQIIGSHAGELIHEWVVAMAGAVKLSTIAGAVHIYPTLSEISKRAASQFFSGKILSETTKKILRFLFSLKGRACTPQS